MNRRTFLSFGAAAIAATAVPSAVLVKMKVFFGVPPVFVSHPAITLVKTTTAYDCWEMRWYTMINATLQDGKEYLAVDYHDEEDEAEDVLKNICYPAMQRRIDYIDDPDLYPDLKAFDDNYKQPAGMGCVVEVKRIGSA